jgi:hypothetical protein
MHAQDSTPAHEHARTRVTQKNVPKAKDGETKIANEADPALCVIKSDDAGIATKTGEALPKESDGRDRMTRVTNEAMSGENLSLQPAREEWVRDQIHLGAETNLREESRSEKSESSAESDLKCTPHEGTSNPQPALPN